LLLSRLPCCCLWVCRPIYRDIAGQLLASPDSTDCANINTSKVSAAAETLSSGIIHPVTAVRDLLVTAALGADAGGWIGPRGCPVPRGTAEKAVTFFPRSQPCRPYNTEDAVVNAPLMYLPSKREVWGLGGVREGTLFINRTESERDLFAAVQACTSLPIRSRSRVLLRTIPWPTITASTADATGTLKTMSCLSTIAADAGAILAVEMAAKARAPHVILELALGTHSLPAATATAGSSTADACVDRRHLPLIYAVVCPRQKDVDRLQDRWRPYTVSTGRDAATQTLKSEPLTPSSVVLLTPAWICVLLLCAANSAVGTTK
jgi:hypothetical protein